MLMKVWISVQSFLTVFTDRFYMDVAIACVKNHLLPFFIGKLVQAKAFAVDRHPVQRADIRAAMTALIMYSHARPSQIKSLSLLTLCEELMHLAYCMFLFKNYGTVNYNC
jgi:hypothetical protein